MNKTFALLVFALLAGSLFFPRQVSAQAPDKMSYQAVIRNASDQLLTNTNIGMQISIFEGAIDGDAVYVERHFPTTSENGLVTIEIGTGTIVTGGFADIDWSSGIYFIKSETDPNGGSNYTITGTSQLLSVPYALHSKSSDILIGEISESQITDLQEYLTIETDPLFEASPAAGIVAADIGNWDEAYLWGDYAEEGYLTEETDPSVPTGITVGEMQYWDGSAWITVSPGTDGQVLTFVSDVPTWVTIGAAIGSPTDVYNPTTGKIWMDRNLGAKQAATSSTDVAAYGDLYQWGRATDGHQLRRSETTEVLSVGSDTPGHGYFIVAPKDPHDWRDPQNNNLWQGINGINNPCPAGYRLPTDAELEAEMLSWSSENMAGAFASPLKLPVAGRRVFSSGKLEHVGSYGHYWSGTVFGLASRCLFFYSTDALMSTARRALGASVRCIKD